MEKQQQEYRCEPNGSSKMNEWIREFVPGTRGDSRASSRAGTQARSSWHLAKKKLHLALPLWMRGLGDEGGVRFFS
jgi:hypothetical protein